MSETSLLADIGGTNARFALLSPGGLGPVETLRVSDYPSVEGAITRFLTVRKAPAPASAILGIAAPIDGPICRILNSHWIVDRDQLAARFGFQTVQLINDFQALAWALPQLRDEDLHFIGAARPQRGSTMIVLGPGTGFGLAALMPRGNRPIAVATEAGHSTLAGGTDREAAIIEVLRSKFGHVSIERAVSGPGLENLHGAIAIVDGTEGMHRRAHDITAAALEGSSDTCRAALDVFCALLGSVAGNFALTFEARGGVYLAGGIAPRIAGYLAASAFRQRFTAKGRFQPYLESIATAVIAHPNTAFLGLRALAERARSTRP